MLVGQAAKEQWVNATNTIFDFPALLGKTFSQVEDEVQHLPYTVVDRDGRPMIQVEHEHQVQEYSPEAITAHMLAYLKHIAEAKIGKPVNYAMISRPSFLDKAELDGSEHPYHSEATKARYFPILGSISAELVILESARGSFCLGRSSIVLLWR